VYPPVRQFESSELHQRLVMKDHEWAMRGGKALPSVSRLLLLASAVALVSIVAAVYAVAAGAAPTCTAGVKIVGGVPARSSCGPAKATATVGAKTFRFTSGECLAGGRFTVNIGTLSFASSSTTSYFGVSLPATHAGIYTGKQVTLSFNRGPSRVSLSPGAGAKVVLKPGLRSGSFTGKDLGGRPVHGSFSC
jgi:hypothetical protein